MLTARLENLKSYIPDPFHSLSGRFPEQVRARPRVWGWGWISLLLRWWMDSGCNLAFLSFSFRFTETRKDEGDLLSRDHAQVNWPKLISRQIQIQIQNPDLVKSKFQFRSWLIQVQISPKWQNLHSPVDLQRVAIEKAAAVLVLCNKFSGNPSWWWWCRWWWWWCRYSDVYDAVLVMCRGSLETQDGCLTGCQCCW